MELEALERALQEIEALEAIYGYDGADGFTVLSDSELIAARSAVEAVSHVSADWVAPQLEIKLKISLELGAGEVVAWLRCSLPPGYPQIAAGVSVSVEGLDKKTQQNLSLMLKQKALTLVGDEAVMEIVQELQVIAPSVVEEHRKTRSKNEPPQPPTSAAPLAASVFGRRWIWAHHITDTGRCKAIINEAGEASLGGFLKSGYPGIVVVEGEAQACNEFTQWLKGSKSRPGGFGRNWGHHVRGEIVTLHGMRKLPDTFEEVKELAVLAQVCKDRGLESEFLEYVLQHSKNDTKAKAKATDKAD